MALFRQIEKDCLEVIEAFWLLEGVRQLCECRSRAEEQRRLAAWHTFHNGRGTAATVLTAIRTSRRVPMLACGLDFGTSNSTIGVVRNGTPVLVPVEGDAN